MFSWSDVFVKIGWEAEDDAELLDKFWLRVECERMMH